MFSTEECFNSDAFILLYCWLLLTMRLFFILMVGGGLDRCEKASHLVLLEVVLALVLYGLIEVK